MDSRPCRTCGLPVTWTSHVVNGTTLDLPAHHLAPCGAPCAGGGVTTWEAPTSHRVAECGVPGCCGGRVPPAADRRLS